MQLQENEKETLAAAGPDKAAWVFTIVSFTTSLGISGSRVQYLAVAPPVRQSRPGYFSCLLGSGVFFGVSFLHRIYC
ncbi:MAG: hypothetical protein ACTSWN_09465 [Promethearchaeota archaeon]